ncbi:hypothetical protein AX15_003976 [Amanita polypyramis BW_CC]|nr:hypothetical protein AX15_003976 [Amanita polypyramis BW_CC]
MFLSVLILLHATLAVARLFHSLPHDTYAFPKYRVAFLNGLPVLNQTAHNWLSHGLHGGVTEFLDQPWRDDSWHSTRKEIQGTQDMPLPPSTANYTLEHMKMGPRDAYICLIPSPPDVSSPTVDDETTTDISPARSWSLLQPLMGTCLYHRQGWFTYSYCHNHEIRQFKELSQANPHHFTGAYKPEEDPEWESYTLGKAPANSESGADLTVAEQNARAVNLELARNAGSHYLVQRWGDGSICDKTGKSREVEVQFHCSMTMTDTILFVKEAKTCSYVLVIHTPRLCGEPGFKSLLESDDETQIHCREIIPDALSESDTTSTTTSATTTSDAKVGQAGPPLPVTDYPLKIARHKITPPPPSTMKQKPEKDYVYEEILRKALEAVFGGNAKFAPGNAEEIPGYDNGNEVVVELNGNELMDQSSGAVEELMGALQAAGYDVRTEKVVEADLDVGQDSGAPREKKAGDDDDSGHDEL